MTLIGKLAMFVKHSITTGCAFAQGEGLRGLWIIRCSVFYGLGALAGLQMDRGPAGSKGFYHQASLPISVLQ